MADPVRTSPICTLYADAPAAAVQLAVMLEAVAVQLDDSTGAAGLQVAAFPPEVAACPETPWTTQIGRCTLRFTVADSSSPVGVVPSETNTFTGSVPSFGLQVNDACPVNGRASLDDV